jgi:hypothetical protein
MIVPKMKRKKGHRVHLSGVSSARIMLYVIIMNLKLKTQQVKNYTSSSTFMGYETTKMSHEKKTSLCF